MTTTVPELTGIQFRSATVTALQPEERVIELRAVPYGVETQLSPRLFESFLPKAFGLATKDPQRITLYDRHSTEGGSAVGRALTVEDREDGVYIRARVSATRAGDELLTLAADDVLGEASVEFQPIEEEMRVTRRGEATVVKHRRARLLGVALVPHGAYGRNATVLSVRDAASTKAREEVLARLRGLHA